MPLNDAERRLVRALSKTMFRRSGALGLDGDDAQVVQWFDRHMDRMPAFDRGQVHALLAAFAAGYAAYTTRPTARFVSATHEEREQYMRTWETSNIYTQRMVYDGLRTLLTMAYSESAAVNQKLGAPDRLEYALERESEREQAARQNEELAK